VKGVLKILLFLLVSAYLVAVLGFVGRQYNAVTCSGMDVLIRDSLALGLVTASDIRDLVQAVCPEVTGIPVTAIDAGGIEKKLAGHPAIADAQVYTNIQGRLVIEVAQRVPVARIEDRDHRHYFLDAEGYIIPAGMDYTPHILHVNGEIPGRYRKETSIGQSETDREGKNTMAEILELAKFIDADPFWKSQIVQVYVNGKGEFELIPRVGSQIILFGDGEGMETKFFKLRTLYRQGFSQTGWNRYEIINLKYTNQVICTKR
jgi:cell division protein FtsQ